MDRHAAESAFARARTFVARHARALDWARWRCRFEGGRTDDALDLLAAYQNGDGGFGHALEPDAWHPASSPLQTWAATEILRELDVLDAEHPLVAGAVRYLAGGADFDGRRWPRAVPAVNDHPHAPWWTYHPGAPDDGYNPTAALAGFVWRVARPDTAARDLGVRVAREAAAGYLAAPPRTDMHEVRCFQRLAEYARAAGADEAFLAPLAARLAADVDRLIEPDASVWMREYVARPSFFFDAPDSPYAAGRGALARREAEVLVESQNDNGGWSVTWRWDTDPDAFAVAALWWRATMAMENAAFIRNFAPA